jgi:hypothetical protein
VAVLSTGNSYLAESLTPEPEMREPEQRVELEMRFVGEQDGEPERELKAAIEEFLSVEKTVSAAYLARVCFGKETTPSVALAIRTAEGGGGETISRRIGAIFSAMFRTDAQLDLFFVTDEQEAQLQTVCAPFFRRNVGADNSL